jgi:preprotein translocase subunit SecG
MWLTYTCTILLLIVGFLLMFIVLLQRGRGGGLAGAFGGQGGHSAFGTKAGDVFTKITIVMAVIWVILAGVTGFAMRHDAESGHKDGSEVDNKPQISAGEGKTESEPKKTDKTENPFSQPIGKSESGKTDSQKTSVTITPKKTPQPQKTGKTTDPVKKKTSVPEKKNPVKKTSEKTNLVKKTEAKKPTTKKTVKKPTVKKPTVKKPAVKKPAVKKTTPAPKGKTGKTPTAKKTTGS